jgi:hypothetical protein
MLRSLKHKSGNAMGPRIIRRGAISIAVTKFASSVVASGARSAAMTAGVIIAANTAAINGVGATITVGGNKLDLMFCRG